jgi:hypothetical protein
MAKVILNTTSITKTFTNSILELQVAKNGGDYHKSGAMPYLAGYLESQLVALIDQLPKAKRAKVLGDMARDTLKFEAQAEVLIEMK